MINIYNYDQEKWKSWEENLAMKVKKNKKEVSKCWTKKNKLLSITNNKHLSYSFFKTLTPCSADWPVGVGQGKRGGVMQFGAEVTY